MLLVKTILIKCIVATTVAYNVATKFVERWDLTHITKLPTTENSGRADSHASIPAITDYSDRADSHASIPVITSSRAKLKSNNKT